jgi:hypothetical protein
LLPFIPLLDSLHLVGPAAENDVERLRAIAKAADSISLGDTVNSFFRKTNNWSLQPVSGGWVRGWVHEVQGEGGIIFLSGHFGGYIQHWVAAGWVQGCIRCRVAGGREEVTSQADEWVR